MGRALLLWALIVLAIVCTAEARPQPRRPYPLTAGRRTKRDRLAEGQTSWSEMRDRVLRDHTTNPRDVHPPTAVKVPPHPIRPYQR